MYVILFDIIYPLSIFEQMHKIPCNFNKELSLEKFCQIGNHLAGHVPPNKKLFGWTVPPNKKLFGGTVLSNSLPYKFE